MLLLILKLTLTPTLIAVASLIGRRWGPTVSGWLVGLPFTSGPIAYILAVSHGSSFAASAAVATLAGVLSEAAFSLAMGWIGLLLGWPFALLGGCVAFFAVLFVLQQLPLAVGMVFLAAMLALVIALCLMPAHGSSAPWIAFQARLARATMPSSVASTPIAPTTPTAGAKAGGALPWWDLPARMIIATLFVILLTGVSSGLGAQLTGLLAPFPIYVSILAVFAYQQDGPHAAVGTLRGLLLGLFSFSAFFLIVALLLTRLGVLPTFGLAIVVALAIQGGSLWALRWAAHWSRATSSAAN